MPQFCRSLFVAAGLALSLVAQAQDLWPNRPGAGVGPAYPSKPLRLIVPFPAGGPVDLLARVIGKQMSDSIGQPVIVDIRAGATGTIGTAELARSAPDGYTLVMLTSSHTISAAVMKLPFDIYRDFSYVSLIADAPFVLLAHASVPASTLGELIALARHKPRSLTYASFGSGSTSHLAGELLARAAGIEIVHVPYKGSSPAVNDLVGGHVQLLFATTAVSTPHVDAGKLKRIAAAGATRFALLPDLPTIAEQGFPGFGAGVWFGVAAPAGVAPAVLARLHREAVGALAATEVKQRLESLGAVTIGSSPAEFAGFIRAEAGRFAKVVGESNIKVE